MQIDDVEDWIAEAKDRLKSWGAEELRQLKLQRDAAGDISIKGWPSETVNYIVMRHGGRAPTGTGMRKERERPEVCDTDEIVSRLTQGHAAGEEIRAVLYAHYVFRFSVRQGARMTHKSVRTYRSLLEAGQTWVAGSLSERLAA
jgi:hypothetical protein